MGVLRFLLALIVCVDHFHGAVRASLPAFLGLGADMAVEVFFIISGFYMGMILHVKYAGESRTTAFYKSRFFRLFPVYWAILLCYLAAIAALRLGTGRWWHLGDWGQTMVGLDGASFLYAIASNLGIFGENVLFFLSMTTPASLFGAFSPEHPPSWGVLFIPQAWSIEIELYFYLLAPWLVRLRTRTLVPVVLACLGGKLWLKNIGLINDSWYLRNPFLDMGLFMLGILAYRLYKARFETGGQAALRGGLSVALLAALALYHKETAHPLFPLAVHACAFLGVPALFSLTRRITADRMVGELSYPIYLSHQMIFYVVAVCAGFSWVIPLSLAATVGFSALIFATLGRAVDTYRHGKY
ncbi:acyltransferase family protein [Fundidesulfovibrio terrae]|uniref:acyltransferase family protein n=1 Tax=Fundidesulfovibrio terrae TaxID=2922866 RepID=UPI001FAFF693|nr:acyltransferase [Fundidesulfovibrio terrae]